MKIKLTKVASLILTAAALTAVPGMSRAADPTNAPVAPAHKAAHHGLPFKGKVAAVDTNAMTFTAGTTTFTITSATKMLKDGKPAVLADIPVGAVVVVFYRKDDAGSATALTVRVLPPKKASPPATAAPATAPQ